MISLKNLIPSQIIPFTKKYLLGKGEDSNYVRQFYSQCGEDIVINQIAQQLNLPEKGFYIDVGAYHPFEKSNTFKLYQNGWVGINIDSNPYCKPLFDKHRPRDTNLNIGISNESGILPFYIVDKNSSMNTFSKKNLEDLNMLACVKEVINVPLLPLSDVIQKYVPENKRIDFLNIDAEGFEMEILSSISWETKKPTLIALEQNNVYNMEDVIRSDAFIYLNERGYTPVSMLFIIKSISTVIYLSKT